MKKVRFDPLDYRPVVRLQKNLRSCGKMGMTEVIVNNYWALITMF